MRIFPFRIGPWLADGLRAFPCASQIFNSQLSIVNCTRSCTSTHRHASEALLVQRYNGIYIRCSLRPKLPSRDEKKLLGTGIYSLTLPPRRQTLRPQTLHIINYRGTLPPMGAYRRCACGWTIVCGDGRRQKNFIFSFFHFFIRTLSAAHIILYIGFYIILLILLSIYYL